MLQAYLAKITNVNILLMFELQKKNSSGNVNNTLCSNNAKLVFTHSFFIDINSH